MEDLNTSKNSSVIQCAMLWANRPLGMMDASGLTTSPATKSWHNVHFPEDLKKDISCKVLWIPLWTGTGFSSMEVSKPKKESCFGFSDLFSSLLEACGRKGSCFSWHHSAVKTSNPSTVFLQPCLAPRPWSRSPTGINLPLIHPLSKNHYSERWWEQPGQGW